MFSKADFAQLMIDRRRSLKLNQAEIADQLGVARKSIGAWENPDSPAMPRDFAILSRWCRLLGLTLGEALDNRPLPEEGFVQDPAHLAAVKLCYSRYLHDRAFAHLLHKMMACDSATLERIDVMTQTLATLVKEDGYDVSTADRRWDEIVKCARERGVQRSGAVPEPLSEGH